MKRENGKPAKQRIKNWLLQRKNRLRIADTFVIGSIMTLFSAAAVQSPLSHTYECSIGMIYPFSMGAQVVYLDRLF